MSDAATKSSLDIKSSAIEELKAKNSKLLPHKWPQSARDELLLHLETVVKEYVYLEGYWIELAEWTYRFGQTERAISIYERATSSAPFCLNLWVSRLKFLILTNSSSSFMDSLFQLAKKYIGGYFNAHVFYDLWCDWLSREQRQVDQALMLADALENLTLYAYSGYYQLLSLLIRDSDVELAISERFQIQGHCDSWLIQITKSHQKRVESVWMLEKELKRQTFYPTQLPMTQVRAWQQRMERAPNDDEREMIYRRAISVAAQNEHLWLGFVRWSMAAERKALVELFDLGCKALPSRNYKFRVHSALYHEWAGESLELQKQIWNSLCRDLRYFGTAQKEVIEQYSRYLIRTEPDHGRLALSKWLEEPLPEDVKVYLLTALAKVGAPAFEEYIMADSIIYWQERFLATDPEERDQIYRIAPAGSLDSLYLKHLLETNLTKYIDTFNSLHPSALDPSRLGLIEDK